MRILNYILLFTLCFGALYCQDADLHGRVKTSIYGSGGFVIAEPSGNWTNISQYLNGFNLSCAETDTLMKFYLGNKNFKIPIQTGKSFYEINTDSIDSFNFLPVKFQVYVSNMALPIGTADNYLFNDEGIWVSNENGLKRTYDLRYYQTDSLFIRQINTACQEIVNSVPQYYYINPDIDDGQQINMYITNDGEIFSYKFQLCYHNLIDNLIETLNSELPEYDRIRYQFIKK